MSLPPAEYLTIFSFDTQAYAIKEKYPTPVVEAVEIITKLILLSDGNVDTLGRLIYRGMRENIFLLEEDSDSEGGKESFTLLNVITHSRKEVRERTNKVASYYYQLRGIDAVRATADLYYWLERQYQNKQFGEKIDPNVNCDEIRVEFDAPRPKLNLPERDSSSEGEIVAVKSRNPKKTNITKKVEKRNAGKESKSEFVGDGIIVRRVATGKKNPPKKIGKSIPKK